MESEKSPPRSDVGQEVRIADLAPGMEVFGRYLVWEKSKLVARSGRPYLNLLLGDETGRMEARVWDRADELDARFDVHDVVEVQARVVRYQNRLQLNVTDLRRVEATDADLARFVPSGHRDTEALWQELSGIVASLSNAHLRRLLEEILADEELAARLRQAPAAKSIHHAWRGGLLEHVVSVCRLADRICEHYAAWLPGLLDRDVVLAGLVLHDLGKVWELDPITFSYTDEGRLLGHICLAFDFVSERIRRHPDFPRELALHLEHVILSHHGELEYGSPKRPKTAEAWVVHFVDILDGRLTWLAGALEDLPEGGWTDYVRFHGRYFWHPPRPSGEPGSGAQEAGGHSESGAPGDAARAEGPEPRASGSQGPQEPVPRQLPLLGDD